MNKKYLTFRPDDGSLFLGRMSSEVFRSCYPELIWRFNPWTGKARDSRDVESDPTGILIVPPKSNVLPFIRSVS